MLLHSLLDILRDSILITGLVIVMMMMIEALNIESHGRFASRLQKTKFGQVLFGAALGLVPGCIGGFATVSLYTHGLFGFGALIAMMIASSGDEAFVMLAMFPEKALILFGILFVIAVVAGLLTDFAAGIIRKRKGLPTAVPDGCCAEGFELHGQEKMVEHDRGKRHFGWKRAVLAAGLAVFIAALGSGLLEHDHGEHHEGHAGEETAMASGKHCCGVPATASGEHCCEVPATTPAEACCVQTADTRNGHCCEGSHEGHAGGHCCGYGHEGHAGCESSQAGATAAEPGIEAGHELKIDLLSESWMNVLFACLSVIMLAVIIFAPDHFIEEHLWHHIIHKHLATIFLWTFGILAGIALLMHFIDISAWVSGNTALMILLAVAIGIIPESGPHLIFVTLYAAGLVPFPVLLASSISQDGHASIPLLAESKKSFLWAKVINCAVALLCGFTAMLFV